jgi:hypothetical protein
VARYKALQAGHPRHAWGAIKDGHANIPSTAEALAILRSAGELYESDSVQQGVQYLATRVFVHPRPMAERGGRWPLTRYLVYGLLGLTQWPQWSHDQVRRECGDLDVPVSVVEAVDHCVRWLESHRIGDGWPDRADQPRCSVLQTSTAILALSKINRLPSEVTAARDLLTKVQDRRSGSWPEMVATGAYAKSGSAPHTALAILALSGGNDVHRRHAERGCDWLLAHASRWERATHSELHDGVEPWVHMSFSLCLRACLRMGIDPLSPALRPTIEFLEELWDDADDEWRAGANERGSVHGSHAVVLAYDELKRAQARVDPSTFFALVRAGRAAESDARENYRLAVTEFSIALIDERSGQQWSLLGAGARSHQLIRVIASHQYGAGQDRPVSLDTLSAVTKDPKTMIRRLNHQVSLATGGRLPRLIFVPRGATNCQLAVRLQTRADEQLDEHKSPIDEPSSKELSAGGPKQV